MELLTEQKFEYQNHNKWWEAGKLYSKTRRIDYYTKINQQINIRQQNLINYIFQEKSKSNLNQTQLDKYQQELDDMENDKKDEALIRRNKENNSK